MTKSAKIFIFFILILFLVVAGERYLEYIHNKNFEILVNTSCQLGEQGCFVADCEAGPDCDQTPYKKVSILAKEAPKCLGEHTCENFTCSGLESCEITYCSEETLEDGEKCN